MTTTTQTAIRSLVSGLALAALIGTAAMAQDGRLNGQVAEVFGKSIVLTTPEGRILVTLPEGAEAPAAGARITVVGQRNGMTMTARSIEMPPPPPARGRPLASATTMPPVLAALDLTEVVTRQERPRHGGTETHIHGRLPDGAWMRAKLRDGQLAEAQVATGELPPSLIAALLPPAIETARETTRIARVAKIDHKPKGEIKIEGFAVDGTRIEAEFDRAGTLLKLERARRDDRRSLSEEGLRARLAELGYSEVGFVHRGGRHAEAVARNPYGEWVDVRMNDRGEIDRERAWTR